MALALADFGRDPCSSEFDTDRYSKKTQKLLIEFTSGHDSAMITDRRKVTSKWSLYGMFSFPFLPLESIQNLSPGLYVPYKKDTYPNLRQRLKSDILRIKTNSTPQCWCGLAAIY